jgi:NADPH:quinone reductase-like Zn-dependent oxidoreductase
MKAIIIEQAGGVENLILTEVPTPAISENEVLVKVKAISINPVDVKARSIPGLLSGLLGEENSKILGWDISGNIVNVGNKVSDLKNGDAVFGMVNFPGHGKAYAEYVAVPADQLAIKPKTVSYEEAAAATLAALTAYQALITNAKIKSGDRVLIHAAAGGVGHYAVQIAKSKNAYVIATGSKKNKEFILQLGADEFIDYQTQKFEEEVTNLDVVLDTLGNKVYDNSLKTLKKGGQIITLPYPLTEDQEKETNALGLKGYRIVVTSNGENMKEIANLLQLKKLNSHISFNFPFEEMAAAHVQLESERTKGKVVVTIQ